MEFDQTDCARLAGQAQYARIKAVLCDADLEAEDRGPHDILLRSDWYDACQIPAIHAPEEYRILLAAGGPGVCIIGYLNRESEPITAQMQVHRVWGPWEDFEPADEGTVEETLLSYARCFIPVCIA